MEFANKLVLVTGAAQGIGAQVARSFAERGARLALVDRQAAPLTRLAADLRESGTAVLPFVADLTDGAAIEHAVARSEEELGPIDVLASVAGVLYLGEILTCGDQDWDDSFAINTTAVFKLTRAVGKRMCQRKRGSIVVVGSNAARVPRMGMAAYAASKAATAHFVRCLALELAVDGVRCNVVSPGSTDTAMQRLLWTSANDGLKAIRGTQEKYRLGIPLGRIAEAQDVAEAVCFMASERARHITMHDLCVDGGATLGV